MNAPLPEVVGPYRILRPIARGGMAEVYEVEELATGEHLALKVLMQTGGALARFNREYEAMIRLNHPNIVRVYNYGSYEKLPWLSMELIEGTPIQAYAKRCGRPGTRERTREVIRVAYDLAMALHHIHDRGLIHRDLKSANVLVLPDGRVKLLDFGTARVSDPIEHITRDGEFIGTFAYASPEQLINKGIDHRADLYSYGVLLYRLATGKRPFDAKELAKLARQHVKEQPPPPSGLVDLPPGLEEVILSLLEKKPENRPQSGQEIADALEAVAGEPLYPPGTLDVDLSSERLVGREEQISQLYAFLDREASGEGEAPGSQPADMAVVVGLQGSGRHRVMQVMQREVERRHWRTLSLRFRRATEDLDQVTATTMALVRSFGDSPHRDARPYIRALLEVEQATSLSIAERLEVLRSAGAQLLAVRGRLDKKPLLLQIRGLQHAGPVGFEAIVGLREEIAALRAPVLMLADCDEAADDPESMARKRLPDALRLNLQPMNVREVALLVGSMLHRRPPPAAIARQIYQASGGLPTYVEEVVNGLVQRGLLRVKSKDTNRIEWAQRDDIVIPVPQGAVERVIEQLAALPADRRRILEAMALCGGEASLKVLAGALQCRPAELMPALDDLAHRGWATVKRRQRNPYARWRLVLAEQVVLDQIHPCRRKVLEKLLIEQVADEPAFVAQIRLLLKVGRLPEALQRARDWAIHHLAKNRPVTALEVLDFVIPELDADQAEAKPGISRDVAIRAQLYLLNATCLQLARPTDPQLARSLTKATKGSTPGDLFEAEINLTRANIQRVIGHYPNFRKHLMEAWYVVEHTAPTALGANVATLLGWSNRMAGHVDDAATWHGRARRIAVQVGIPAVRAHADVGVASWQFARGLIAEAERTVVGAIEVFDEVGDMRGLSEALPIWIDALRMQGRWSEALRVLHQQMPGMRQSEAPTFYVRMLLANAWCEVDLGRLGRAQECVDELGATLRRGENLHLRLQANLVWGRILKASGLTDQALAQLREVSSRASAAGLVVLAEHANALEAECLWEMGELRTATHMFTKAVQRLEATGDVPGLVAACTAQSRALAEKVDVDRIFRPVRDWMDQQPAYATRIGYAVARGRGLSARGQDATQAFIDAQKLIDEVSANLAPTDAAALALHPWTRHIRRARVKARRADKEPA